MGRSAYGLFKTLMDPMTLLFAAASAALLVSISRRLRRGALVAAGAPVVLLYAASIHPVSNAACYFLEKDYIEAAGAATPALDMVVALGAGLEDEQYLKEPNLSQETSQRLLGAVAAMRKGGARLLVCSGGGAGRVTEAEAMASAAERLGVPRDRIWAEGKSVDTRGHADELARLFPDGRARIGLATSAYHMKRSLAEFNRHFHDVTPVPTGFMYAPRDVSFWWLVPRSSSFRKSSVAFRELLARVRHRLRS